MTQIADESAFLVLNGAHLKKMAKAEEIADAVGVDIQTAGMTLAAAIENGWAIDMDGRFLLLPEGTAAVHEFYRERYGPMRLNAQLLAWYDRFEAINEQFIKQVSDWQGTDGDERAESRLIKTVERLTKILGEILPSIPRYETYVRRFSRSVSFIDRGDKDYVCKPTVDSVHNVWFEFHEDILSVLGRPRDARDGPPDHGKCDDLSLRSRHCRRGCQ